MLWQAHSARLQMPLQFKRAPGTRAQADGVDICCSVMVRYSLFYGVTR